MKPAYIGIDIGKERLDVFIPDHGASAYKNDKHGISSLVKALTILEGPIHVICEPTAGYERKLTTALWEASLPLTIANTYRVRSFARSRGRLAKTDKLDARILSDYGSVNEPSASTKPDAKQLLMEQLMDRLDQLDHMRTQELNRLHQSDPKDIVYKSLKAVLRTIETQIEKLRQQVKETIEDDPQLKAKSDKMQTVTGVGAQTTAKMLAYMPELGSLSRQQAAALAGLAPMNWDSGSMKGQRHIRAGRAKVRKALYMAAVCMSTYNTHAKAVYDRLVLKGKAKKVALVAVMRHLIIHLNSLLKPPSLALI
jgi:transposase